MGDDLQVSGIRRFVFFSLLLTFLAFQGLAAAAFDPAKILAPAGDQQDSTKPRVALLYVNNAKATYDDEINKKMNDNFDAILKQYKVIPGQRYVEMLNKNGISDITTAERGDIMEVFKGEDVDFVLFVEVQPFVRKERITFFTYGIDMTAIVPVKIIDLKGNKYLYNGKFTEFARDSSMIGGIGNKSVSLKALDLVIEKMNPVITTRLPLTRPEAKPDDKDAPK